MDLFLRHKDSIDVKMIPNNTTVEELEIRVERLEEDMFQAQVDIGEAEIDIDSLEFSLQETVETVSNLKIYNHSLVHTSVLLRIVGMEQVKPKIWAIAKIKTQQMVVDWQQCFPS